MSESKKKDDRTRNWTAIVYPDSAPENWRGILDEYHIEWIESPLHDKDKNEDGTPKKPHWHIALCFSGPKSFDQVNELLSPLNCTIPIVVHELKSMVRYMAHLDTPDKVRYDASKIVGHGGADIAEILAPTRRESLNMFNTIVQWIVENNIYEYEDVVMYGISTGDDDWMRALDVCTYKLCCFLSSRRHRRNDCEVKK